MKINFEEMKINEDFIKVIENKVTGRSVIEAIVDTGKQDDAFYVMDAGEILRKHEVWLKTFPKVKPFYAVKCNDSHVVLRILNALGTGFDCASKGEIAKVMSLGVSPDRIIFANPTKPASHIKYAAKVGVNLMTFDNQSELFKIKELHPKSKLVLRIRSDAKDAQCLLGAKYGAEKSYIPELIRLALALELELVGVSFHVGSGCRDNEAVPRAIKAACEVFAEMVYCGADPYILDIGGGFEEHTLHKMSKNIRDALETVPTGINIIAEPGRFYVDTAYMLATSIHGIRGAEYYINDGVYGSFNCVLYDHAIPRPSSLKLDQGELKSYKIWGPTCDSLDMVTESALLPTLDVGDWLVWENMGAYTIAAASTFNGFPVPKVYYYACQDVWKVLCSLMELGEEEYRCGFESSEHFDNPLALQVVN